MFWVEKILISKPVMPRESCNVAFSGSTASSRKGSMRLWVFLRMTPFSLIMISKKPRLTPTGQKPSYILDLANVNQDLKLN